MFRLPCYLRGLQAAALAAVLVFLSAPAGAVSVSPLVVDMSAAGKGARSALTVLNDAKSALPVELRIFRLDLGLNGETKRTPADNDFIVFPPQAMIKPGASQVFRLQWAGEPDIAKSRSYIFSVNQLPVQTAKAASGVQVVFNFSVVVNVAPLSGNAKIEAISAEVSKDGKGEPRAAVTVENKGNRHGYFSDLSLTLTSGGWRHTIPAAELKQLLGIGLVLPGKQRRFLLPVDLPPGASTLSAALK